MLVWTVLLLESFFVGWEIGIGLIIHDALGNARRSNPRRAEQAPRNKDGACEQFGGGVFF